MDSNYCPNCGQRAKVLPITWKGLFVGLTSRWLGMDNKLMRTVWGLVVRPTTVINGYLEGNRVKYIGPLSYFIVMSAVYILTFELVGITAEEFVNSLSQEFQTGEIGIDQQPAMEKYMQDVSNNMRLMVGSIIPFIGLSMVVFYKRRNYLENFLVVTFITAELLWMSIITVIIYAVSGASVLGFMFVINVAYFAWIIGRLNKQKNVFWTYLKGLIVWGVGYLFFVIALSVLTIVYFILFIQ